jgi:hypothetical protein
MIKKLGFLCFVTFLFSAPPGHTQEMSGNHVIYVSSISWHTGIVVPGYTIPDSLWKEGPLYGENTYLEIGWGDKDFFTHEGFNIWYAFKAVFWPTSSALHVNPIHQNVEEYYRDTNVVKIEMNDKQFQKLRVFLVEEFELGMDGMIIPVADGFYPDSNFYKGSSSYYFPNNSNVWVARVIKRADYSIRPIWLQTTGCVINKVKDFGTLVVEKN